MSLAGGGAGSRIVSDTFPPAIPIGSSVWNFVISRSMKTSEVPISYVGSFSDRHAESDAVPLPYTGRAGIQEDFAPGPTGCYRQHTMS